MKQNHAIKYMYIIEQIIVSMFAFKPLIQNLSLL